MVFPSGKCLPHQKDPILSPAIPHPKQRAGETTGSRPALQRCSQRCLPEERRWSRDARDVTGRRKKSKETPKEQFPNSRA